MSHTPINWCSTDVALLDMDGVLLDLAFDDHFWRHALPDRYARVHGLDETTTRARFADWYAQHHGTIQWYDLHFWSRQVGFDVPHLKIHERHHIQVLPGTVRFLQHLKQHRCKRILLTNCHPTAMRLKLAVTGIGRHLDQIVSAFHLDDIKESPSFWPKLEAHLKYPPDRTVLIEDSAANLDAAAEAGFAHLLHMSRPNSKKAAQPHPDYRSEPSLTALLDEARQSPHNGTGCECTAPTPTAPPH